MALFKGLCSLRTHQAIFRCLVDTIHLKASTMPRSRTRLCPINLSVMCKQWHLLLPVDMLPKGGMQGLGMALVEQQHVLGQLLLVAINALLALLSLPLLPLLVALPPLAHLHIVLDMGLGVLLLLLVSLGAGPLCQQVKWAPPLRQQR